MTTAELLDNRDAEEAGFGPPARQQPTAMVAVAQSRAAQEMQAQMIIAKQFPRDQTLAYNKIMQACKRRGLAEESQYAYPRGGQTVTGPSIRLAEVCAQNWGNIDFGIVEVEQRPGESTMMAYAVDLETNTRQAKIFTVKHERHSRNGIAKLSDPRDIYEMTANQGARRLRACILGVIPGDIIDAAVGECEKTMKGKNDEPLADRARRIVDAFEVLGVTKDRIEARLGHKMDSIIEIEVVHLRKMFTSIKDGMAKIDDVFPRVGQPGSADEPPKPPNEGVADKVAAARGKKKADKEPEKTEAPAEEAPAEQATEEPPAPADGAPGPADNFLDRIGNAVDVETCKAIDRDMSLAAQTKKLSDKSLKALRDQLKRKREELESQ